MSADGDTVRAGVRSMPGGRAEQSALAALARLEAAEARLTAERDEALQVGAYLHDREIQHSLDASRAEDLAAGSAPSSAGASWDTVGSGPGSPGGETDDGFIPIVGTRIVSELVTRMERAEAQRDALAEALREIFALCDGPVEDWPEAAIARAALAEAGL